MNAWPPPTHTHTHTHTHTRKTHCEQEVRMLKQSMFAILLPASHEVVSFTLSIIAKVLVNSCNFGLNNVIEILILMVTIKKLVH